MPEHPRPAPNPEYLRAIKDTIFNEWKHLPPEHQATTALVLLADVLGSPYGPWLLEAIALRDAGTDETVSPETGSGSSPLRPDHFQSLPQPFQPESESTQALAYARLYLPGSTLAWYPSAFDGHDLFFGLVVEAQLDFDYFSLDDLRRLRNAAGRGVQIDLRYTARSLGELQASYERVFNHLPEDHDLG